MVWYIITDTHNNLYNYFLNHADISATYDIVSSETFEANDDEPNIDYISEESAPGTEEVFMLQL